MSKQSSHAHMPKSRINKFFGRIWWRISYFFKYDLTSFICGKFPHILAVLCSVAGLYSWSEGVLWPLIVGSVIAFFARMFGFFVSTLRKKEAVALLQSSITLLIISILGCLRLHFVDKIGFVASFFLSLNIAMLLLYVLIIVFVIFIKLFRSIRYKISLWNFSRNERNKAINVALERAGLTRNQVKQVSAKQCYDSEKDELYYEVYFYRGDRQFGYKVWC